MIRQLSMKIASTLMMRLQVQNSTQQGGCQGDIVENGVFDYEWTRTGTRPPPPLHPSPCPYWTSWHLLADLDGKGS
jgi:hypothetical protein